MFSTPLGRLYLGMACATTTAWGALVFAHHWDEGGRRGDSTSARLRSASTALATKSFIVVGLGAIWPLAPVLLNVYGLHLNMERECREIQRQIDENRRLAMERNKREEARKRREKEEQQRREKEEQQRRQEQQRREAMAREQERRNAAKRQTTALGNVNIQITTRNVETVAERPPCPWCLQAH